uniref:Uncharacterized protein n=1 Tax=Knipowitschia caucasica TaxID=637954 RepID=A0AAV2JK62_KNICA
MWEKDAGEQLKICVYQGDECGDVTAAVVSSCLGAYGGFILAWSFPPELAARLAAATPSRGVRNTALWCIILCRLFVKVIQAVLS